jgi:hypothetical protein
MSLTSYRAAPPRARVLLDIFAFSFKYFYFLFFIFYFFNAKNRPVLDGYVFLVVFIEVS